MDPVDTWLRRYPDSPVVRDVLGTADAGTIRAIARRSEPELAEIFFFRVGVGATFGVRRRDGSRVSVKVNKLFGDEAYFDDMHRVQTALADAAFPASRPVRRIGTTVVDEWLDAGLFRDYLRPYPARCRHAFGGVAQDLLPFAEALF